MKNRRYLGSAAAGLVAVGCAVALIGLPGPAGAATRPPGVDLNVLLVTAGSPWVEAIHKELDSEGMPTTVVDLNSPSRPTITDSFLSGTLTGGIPHAFFDGVVLPNNSPAGLSADELTA